MILAEIPCLRGSWRQQNTADPPTKYGCNQRRIEFVIAFGYITNIGIWLVVEPSLWKIWKSVGMIIPNIWKNIKCSKPPTRFGYITMGYTSLGHFPEILGYSFLTMTGFGHPVAFHVGTSSRTSWSCFGARKEMILPIPCPIKEGYFGFSTDIGFIWFYSFWMLLEKSNLPLFCQDLAFQLFYPISS